MNSDFNLSRFVKAQTPVMEAVLQELKQGHKQTHWMWFVFPQLAGLGRSETARYYAIADVNEARAYIQHEVLRARLEECVEAVLGCGVNNPVRIFGNVDALKFHSCLTLFVFIESENMLFRKALDKFYQGIMDYETENIIGNYSKEKHIV